MKNIESKDDLERLYKYLENNSLYKVCSIIKNDISYLEIESNNGKILINKKVLDDNLYFRIMKNYNESRKKIFDDNYKQANNYTLVSHQGEVKIVFDYSKCSITLFASLSDSEVLVEVDEEFLMYMLNKIDNGCEPIIMSKGNDNFYLYMGSLLTIKFNRPLLKYIEEFAVNSKYNKKSVMKLEREM